MGKKIDSKRLITKTAYAKKINVTPGYVTQLCQKKGELTIIKITGGELILLPK